MDDQDTGDLGEELAIVEQRTIPFMGDELAAALTPGGEIFISLNGMHAPCIFSRWWVSCASTG